MLVKTAAKEADGTKRDETRTHFAHRIELLNAAGEIQEHLARGAQVLPPARATVPPWLPAKSARASNLPACCALGPPACAAPCSCHHEACSARSAWPHPGKACLSAWIEHRSGEQPSP